jgi:hypothetical protein
MKNVLLVSAVLCVVVAQSTQAAAPAQNDSEQLYRERLERLEKEVAPSLNPFV